MGGTAANRLLRVLGVLCALAGLVAWVGMAWRAASDPDAVTPSGGEGERLVGWVLGGTLLMIVGMLLLHFATEEAPEGASEEGERE